MLREVLSVIAGSLLPSAGQTVVVPGNCKSPGATRISLSMKSGPLPQQKEMQLVPRNSSGGRMWPIHCQQRQALITDGRNLMILAFHSTFCSFAKTLLSLWLCAGPSEGTQTGLSHCLYTEGLPSSLGKTERQVRKTVTKATTETQLNACVCLKSVRVTLCNPMDCSLPGFSVQRILQARILV